jgi:alanyl-tRNA synthetase
VTNRLYYSDSFLTAFEARVVEYGVRDGRPFVVLDESAFYPTTGGQPHDTGSLGDRRVIDVIDREADAAVMHVLDGSLDVGTRVSATVDWPRRLDHMQQHTGQHILSASFVRLFEIPTVSFHLGAELSTIDLTGTPGPDVVARAEVEANRVVWENRPVAVRFVSADEAARLPLRKEPVRGGTLRLVDVEDFDLSACGGTHVSRTGTVGIIAVQAWERYKGGTRISFACGGRVLSHFRAYRDIVASAVRQLSIQPAELPEAVTRLQGETREVRQQARAQAEQLATYEADVLARGAQDAGGTRVVCAVVDGRDATGLKSLAQAIVVRPGHMVVLVGGSRPSVIVAARSPDVAADAAQMVKALIGRFGGKGGGRPEAAQGGGLDAEPETVRAAAYELLSGGGSPPSSSDSR